MFSCNALCKLLLLLKFQLKYHFTYKAFSDLNPAVLFVVLSGLTLIDLSVFIMTKMTLHCIGLG